jgi:hypothetical protein
LSSGMVSSPEECRTIWLAQEDYYYCPLRQRQEFTLSEIYATVNWPMASRRKALEKQENHKRE